MLLRKTKLVIIMLALSFAAAVSLPMPAANAAPFEFTVTAKTAYDKMIAAAPAATATKLAKQYSDLQTSQKSDIEWDKKINDLHYRNEENMLAARAKVKEIDVAKHAKLSEAIVQARKKYEPLFNMHETLKKQLAMAKSAKNKMMVSILQPQVDTAKTAVTIAKEDIKQKESALKKAKAETVATKKQINATLSSADTLKIKIKAAKGTISSLKKSFSTEGTLLNQAVRKGDAAASSTSFTRMLSWQQQIIEQKQNIYSYEQQINAVIAKANGQIPK
ncbi:hypothetical protein [Paenibacillus gorillae]|uniref:hypothetical protein n=1 Tax=Paenibacillus gorillae TaxID=1243662 RepID=UPI0004B2B9FC|nr:hypothetical protein [Paenibacillus gorillae]